AILAELGIGQNQPQSV
ncbi:unnamed protein product, partial [Adineta steineri]